MDSKNSKKSGRPITCFFEKKARQLRSNETSEPRLDDILSVPSDAMAQSDLPASACTGETGESEQTPVANSSLDPKVRSTADMPEEPHQPKLIKFPLREVGKQKRAFNPKWFDQFKFLHYQEDSDSVVCHTCVIANKRNLLHIDTKKEKAFIETGFTNWKKAIEKFRLHATSATHLHATEVLSRPSHIDEILSQTAAAQKRENSRCLMKLLENIVFLGRQGLALRGDGDDKTGNFYQLVLLRAKDDPALLKWVNKTYDRHMSPQAQNEILKLLALKLLREIATDISTSRCYSILADEATDVSNIQQLVICIRWVTKELIVEEDFIGLMPLDKANATNIATTIKDVILRLGLSKEDAKAQCYDGCSTMTGVRNGVATIIKREIPKCLLTHCYCHALNLAVGDTVKTVPLLKETLEDAYELTRLVKYSPKRQAALKNKQEELRINNLNLPVDNAGDTESFSRLRLLCPTRWTVRAKALQSVTNNYKAILEMLAWCDDSRNTSDSEIRARAGGLEKKMNSFNFMYGLQLSLLVLNHSDNLSATLQRPNICAADAQRTAKLVIETLRRIRSEEHAQSFFERVKTEAFRLGIDEPEPCLPRRKKTPRRFDEGASPHYHETAASHYRAQYYAAIDTVVSTIEDRFDQPDYQIYVNLGQTLLNGATGRDFEENFAKLQNMYGDDFDFLQLKVQLESLACSFSDKSSDSNLMEVVNHLRMLSQGQRMLLDQVFKLAQYCLVMPASNATSERAFSAMRRIKTYLRNTMSQNRLNHTMCLSVHSEILDDIDLKSVLNEFIDNSDRRKLNFARM